MGLAEPGAQEGPGPGRKCAAPAATVRRRDVLSAMAGLPVSACATTGGDLAGGLRPYDGRLLKPAGGPVGPGGLHAWFAGVTTLLLEGEADALLVDGFFSRRGLERVALFKVAPSDAMISAGLARLPAAKIRSVLVAHAHYDHAFDAPEVAAATHARLVAPQSVERIVAGRRTKLAAPPVYLQAEREAFVVGSEAHTPFRVTAIRSPHSPNAFFPGDIRHPLPEKSWFGCYREGANYSFHVEYGAHRILIHPSAAADVGTFEGIRADVVFLGIGTLGKQGKDFFRAYWCHVVRKVGARLVIPVHLDNFFLPAKALRPPPGPLDDVPRAMEWILAAAREDGVEVGLMPLFKGVDLTVATQGLAAPAPAPACTHSPDPPKPSWFLRLVAPIGANCGA